MSWQRAIRDERYKLIEYCVAGKRHTQLFDLAADREEVTNLADRPEHAGPLRELRERLGKERLLLNDGNTPHPFSNKQGVDFWTAFQQP